MPLDASFLAKLRAPRTLHPLRLATAVEIEALNAAVRSGGLCDKGGTKRTQPLIEALVDDVDRVAFPVDDGIPDLLSTSALPLSGTR
ncbi:MAG: Trm112 family protein [Planctomycetota bacterium]